MRGRRLSRVAAAAKRARLEIDSIVVSSAADLKSWQPGAKRPEKPTVEDIAAAARAAFPGTKLGGGMLSTFTELNRKRPKAALFDFITHTTCSIVHAADDRSVMETLETLPAIIGSTRAMIGETPYRIGPSAIAARMNPYGKGVLDNPANGRVCLTEPRSSPARPVQRGLDARLCRRLRLWRGCRRSRWAPQPVRLGSFTTARPTIRSPISIRSTVLPSIRRST